MAMNKNVYIDLMTYYNVMKNILKIIKFSMPTNVPLFSDYWCRVTGLLRLSLGNSHHLPD